MGFFEDVFEGVGDFVSDPFGSIGNFWDDITGVSASEEAAAASNKYGTQAIAEQQRQFDALQALLAPYAEAGTGALQQQQALAGTLGPEAQAAAIAGIENSPRYQSALQAGETSILQNAAATGGVRGGNTQGALAQFAPQLLSSAINDKYAQLGGLTALGQNAAAGVGNAGMATGGNVANLLSNMGNTQASLALGKYNLQKGFLTDLAGLGLQAYGSGAF